MPSPLSIYKAVVVNSSSSSGSVYVKIPTLLGSSESIAVSTMNMYRSSSGWGVPSEGSRVLVVVEDAEMTNVYLLNPPPAPSTSLTITDLPVTIKQPGTN